MTFMSKIFFRKKSSYFDIVVIDDHDSDNWDDVVVLEYDSLNINFSCHKGNTESVRFSWLKFVGISEMPSDNDDWIVVSGDSITDLDKSHLEQIEKYNLNNIENENN